MGAQTPGKEKKVNVVCSVCGKKFSIPLSSFRRYREDFPIDNPKSLHYICNSCQDFNPADDE